MTAAEAHGGGASDEARLRRWLEYVVQAGLDWLDALDAASEDREDDEREDDREAVA